MSADGPDLAGPEEEEDEAVPQTTAKPEDRMKCPVCREEIATGAKKCIKCKSDIAGFKRYFSIGTPALSVLTALVAVISSSVPELYKLFQGRESHLRATLVGFDIDSAHVGHVNLLVNNYGGETGALTSVQLGYSYPAAPANSRDRRQLLINSTTINMSKPPIDVGPFYVKSEEEKAIDISIPIQISTEEYAKLSELNPDGWTSDHPLPPIFQPDTSCTLGISYVAHSGAENFQSLKVDCFRFWPILVDRADPDNSPGLTGML